MFKRIEKRQADRENNYRVRITKNNSLGLGLAQNKALRLSKDLALRPTPWNNKTVVRTRANYLSWPEIRCHPDTAPYFWPTQVVSPGSNNCFVIPWSWP